MKTLCSKPQIVYELLGQQTKNGKKVVVYRLPNKNVQHQAIPRDCGRCKGCRVKKRMDLATRLEHEAQFHQDCWFVTATYDDENLPYGGSLVADHMSEFMKALRKIVPEKIRFFGVGEYGEHTKRPHYHLIIFGLKLEDRKIQYVKPSHTGPDPLLAQLIQTEVNAGIKYFQSETLERAWKKGHIQATGVSAATMQYVAKFHIDKVSGDQAEEHYQRPILETGELILVEPERTRMSRNPGLGRKWIEKYWKDIYPRGYMVGPGGIKFAPPKYYDKYIEENHPDIYDQVKQKRAESIDLEWSIPQRRAAVDLVRDAQMTLHRKPRALS